MRKTVILSKDKQKPASSFESLLKTCRLLKVCMDTFLLLNNVVIESHVNVLSVKFSVNLKTKFLNLFKNFSGFFEPGVACYVYCPPWEKMLCYPGETNMGRSDAHLIWERLYEPGTVHPPFFSHHHCNQRCWGRSLGIQGKMRHQPPTSG